MYIIRKVELNPNYFEEVKEIKRNNKHWQDLNTCYLFY